MGMEATHASGGGCSPGEEPRQRPPVTCPSPGAEQPALKKPGWQQAPEAREAHGPCFKWTLAFSPSHHAQLGNAIFISTFS